MLVACTSNRPREPRDGRSSPGSALKPSRISVLISGDPTALIRERRLNARSIIPSTILTPISPHTSPSPVSCRHAPSMIDKYYCCLLSTFRYELGPYRVLYDAWSGDISEEKLRYDILVYMRAEVRVVMGFANSNFLPRYILTCFFLTCDLIPLQLHVYLYNYNNQSNSSMNLTTYM